MDPTQWHAAAWLAEKGLAAEGLTAGSLLGVLLVYALAGTVKGALGFGLPLVAGAILPQFVPLPLVMAVNALLLPVTNLVQFARAGAPGPTVRAHWTVLAGLALAVPLAALFVARADPRLVALAFGGFVTLAALANLAMPSMRIPERMRGKAGLATGLAGGIVAALTTAPGPVFVLYLAGTGAARAAMMGALGLFLLVSGLLVSLSFAALDLLTVPRAMLALACLAPALIGMRLGDALADRVPADRLRLVVLSVLVALGLRTALTALTG